MDDTHTFVYRSSVHPASSGKDQNLRAEHFESKEDSPEVVKVSNDDPSRIPVIDPSEIVGRTYLTAPTEDGSRDRAKIVKAIVEYENDLAIHPERIRYLVRVKDKESLLAYDEIMDAIAAQIDDEDVVWKFKRISGHQGPLKPGDKNYKGSSYNVQIKWESREISWEPLNILAADDPVTCAQYALENGLLDLPGWVRFCRLARRTKKLLREVKQAKLRSFNLAPKYKYGYEVPRNYQHALELDKANGNHKWKEATELEMAMMRQYEVFSSLGYKARIPNGYIKIRLRLIYNVKHDGRHRARLVAGGHLTPVPLTSVYSGVVSLCSIRIVTFLAELNSMEVWATDIGSAYLEAKTAEKIVIEAGPEFGELEGHLLKFECALYGLRTSGQRWHERFADCLRQMKFEASKADPDIWMC